jgi:hypothetical protein
MGVADGLIHFQDGSRSGGVRSDSKEDWAVGGTHFIQRMWCSSAYSTIKCILIRIVGRLSKGFFMCGRQWDDGNGARRALHSSCAEGSGMMEMMHGRHYIVAEKCNQSRP